MSAITVRAASNDDSARIGALRQSLQTAMSQMRGGELLWHDKHAQPDLHRSMIFVAEIADYVVGYLLAVMRDSEVEIFEIHVDADARSVGVGDSLLSHALLAARSEGASSVVADALPGDRDTKNLFERAGLVSQRLMMRKELP